MRKHADGLHTGMPEWRPQDHTTYQYGGTGTVNTLLLRGTVVDSGTGGLNLRTCYAYDNQGNKISETSPRAGLATCP